MIEGLKPYSKYKESGQVWLGKVPAHWDLKPGHSAFTKRKLSNVGLKEDIKKLFQKFMRTKTGMTTSEGTGLGLAMVKRIGLSALDKEVSPNAVLVVLLT